MVMRTTPSFPPPPATSAAGGQEDKGLFLGPSSRWTSAQPPPSGSPPPGLVRLPHPLIRALPGKRLWQGPLGPLIAGQVSTRPSLGPRPLPPAGTQLRALCSGTMKACPQTQATSIQAETSGRPAHSPRLLSADRSASGVLRGPRMACVPRTRPRAPQPCPGCTSPPRTRSGRERGRRGRRAPGVLTSLSWSREPVASRKPSSSPLRSPPLDTATFIWRQGETGSASTDLTPSRCWRGVGREGAGPGQAPDPRPQAGAELARAGAERCPAIRSRP